jgi:hypothetical protein
MCHARGCHGVVKPELLMCWAHWRMVPRNIQAAVYAAYRPGQCDDKKPSASWFVAADAAIGFVALRTGHALSLKEKTALRPFGYGGLP